MRLALAGRQRWRCAPAARTLTYRASASKAASSSARAASPCAGLSIVELKGLLAASGASSAGAAELSRRLSTSSARRWHSSPAAGAEPRAFVASTSWQQVPPGAVLDPGMEVRMDLASGTSYARILPPPGSPLASEEPPRRKALASPAAGAGSSSLAESAQLLEWGCKVCVSSDVAEVKRLQRRHWEPDMEGFCGRTGTVTHLDSEGDVSVEFENEGSWTTWVYKPEVLRNEPLRVVGEPPSRPPPEEETPDQEDLSFRCMVTEFEL